MALVYITCRDEKEAQKISLHLLRKKLIACANIFPIKSMYWWKGKIANGKEHAVFAKTSDKNFKKIAAEVKKVHSYSIPCILKIGATADKDYEDWANAEMK